MNQLEVIEQVKKLVKNQHVLKELIEIQSEKLELIYQYIQTFRKSNE